MNEAPAPFNDPARGVLRRGAYGVILCDPPWRFLAGKGSRSVERHYPTMTRAELLALPVAQLAAPDCILVMWTTGPFHRFAGDLAEAWGFTVKTLGGWAKLSKLSKGLGDPDAKLAMGTGYILRGAGEFTLWAKRGRPRQLARNVRNMMVEPLREHSRKPDRMHTDLERMFEGPRVELFARATRPGWDTWGNQVGKFDARDDEWRTVEPVAGGAGEPAAAG